MRIDSPRREDLPALRALWKEAFGDGEAFLDAFERTAFSPARCRALFRDGGVAAALYWFDCTFGAGRIAYLYAVATAKKCRGQGLCHALMEDTHRYLATLGYLGAILVPGDAELFRLYETMGYLPACGIHRFFAHRADSSAALTPLTPREYENRRRAYLPAGGVLQEGENIDFLATYALFYEGEDFLLAACKEGERLLVPEILGNAAAAPAILAALDCTFGEFRTPVFDGGADAPFAMYLPLGENRSLPTYFGLAFD